MNGPQPRFPIDIGNPENFWQKEQSIFNIVYSQQNTNPHYVIADNRLAELAVGGKHLLALEVAELTELYAACSPKKHKAPFTN